MGAFLWWRSWHGAATDHKWAVIAVRSGVKVGIVSAVAWALFDHASQNSDRGSICGFDTESYSVYSGFEETEIVAVINAMKDKGIIVNDRLTNWEKRQPIREDNSIDRVRMLRANRRNVTQCNAVISQDSDKDSDKDKEEEESKTAVFPSDYAISVFSVVTSMTSIPGSEIPKVLPAMDAIRKSKKDDQEMIDYLRPFYAEWTRRTSKQGVAYSKANCSWLYDWAVAGEIPVGKQKQYDESWEAMN